MMDEALTNSRGGPTEGGLLVAKELFLKSQLVAIFEKIKDKGFSPAEFGWRATQGPGEGWHSTIPRLVHSPSGFYCDFYFHKKNENTRAIKYTPGRHAHFEMPGSVSWDDLLTHVQRWLEYLKREIESPDVWDMVEQERAALASSPSPDSDNSLFTPEEKQKVVTGLEEIKQYLLTAHRLDPELVEARIKYLEGAADRLGRTDWKGIVLSTIIGMLAEAAVSSETFHDVFRFVGGVLREIYRTTPLLS